MWWEGTRWSSFSLYFMSLGHHPAHPLLFKLWHGCVFTLVARFSCWTSCHRNFLLSPQLSPVLKLAEAAGPELVAAWKSQSSSPLTPPTLFIAIQPLLLCTGEHIWELSPLYSLRFLILVRMEKCRVVIPLGGSVPCWMQQGWIAQKIHLQSGKHKDLWWLFLVLFFLFCFCCCFCNLQWELLKTSSNTTFGDLTCRNFGWFWQWNVVGAESPPC